MNKFETLRNEFHQLQFETNKACDENAKLQGELIHTTKDAIHSACLLEVSAAEVNDWKMNLEFCLQEVKKLEELKRNKENDLGELHQKYKQLNQHRTQLEELKQSLSNELNISKTDLLEAEKEIIRLEPGVQEKVCTIKSLERKISEIESLIEQLNNQIKILNNGHEEKEDELKELESSLNLLQMQKEAFCHQLIVSENCKNKMESELADVNSVIKTLQEQVNNEKRKSQTVEDELAETKCELHDIFLHNQKYHESIIDITDKNQILCAKLQVLQKIREEYNRNMDELKKDITNVRHRKLTYLKDEKKFTLSMGHTAANAYLGCDLGEMMRNLKQDNYHKSPKSCHGASNCNRNLPTYVFKLPRNILNVSNFSNNEGNNELKNSCPPKYACYENRLEKKILRDEERLRMFLENLKKYRRPESSYSFKTSLEDSSTTQVSTNSSNIQSQNETIADYGLCRKNLLDTFMKNQETNRRLEKTIHLSVEKTQNNISAKSDKAQNNSSPMSSTTPQSIKQNEVSDLQNDKALIKDTIPRNTQQSKARQRTSQHVNQQEQANQQEKVALDQVNGTSFSSKEINRTILSRGSNQYLSSSNVLFDQSENISLPKSIKQRNENSFNSHRISSAEQTNETSKNSSKNTAEYLFDIITRKTFSTVDHNHTKQDSAIKEMSSQVEQVHKHYSGDVSKDKFNHNGTYTTRPIIYQPKSIRTVLLSTKSNEKSTNPFTGLQNQEQLGKTDSVKHYQHSENANEPQCDKENVYTNIARNFHHLESQRKLNKHKTFLESE